MTGPDDRFAACRNGKRGRMNVCLPCDNARKRRAEQMKADPFCISAVNRTVDYAPDNGPAVRLRIELQRQRAKGRPWRSAWPLAFSVALRDLDLVEQVSWRQAFSQTRSIWQTGYDRTMRGTMLALPEAA